MLTPTTFALTLKPLAGGKKAITLVEAPPIVSPCACDGVALYSHCKGIPAFSEFFDNTIKFCAMTSKGDLVALGVVNDRASLTTPMDNDKGGVNTYAKDENGEWQFVTKLPSEPSNGDGLGTAVDIADDGTIVATGDFTTPLHIWTTGDKKTWTETVVESLDSESMDRPKISRDGAVVVCAGPFINQAYVFTRANGWAQTWVSSIDDAQFQYSAAAVSKDGSVIALVRVDYDNDATFVDILQSTDLITWTLSQSVQLTITGHTDIGSDQFCQLVMTADLNHILVFADDNWDDVGGALYLLRGAPGSYAQAAYFTTSSVGAFLGSGGIAVTDNGSYALIGVPFSDDVGGTVWLLPCLGTYTGDAIVIDDFATKVVLDIVQPNQGVSMACDGKGENFCLANTDEGDVGFNQIDFFIACFDVLPCQ